MATSSKRRMSGGSLTSWGASSTRFSVQRKGTHCGCCYCSIICSGGYSRADWPFKLIVSIESQQKNYHYTPRSDFHVSVDRLVHLIVEVQSQKNQSDRNRMLLQAACAARLGRLSYRYPFIVVALYIENSGRVTRYFLFQRDDEDPKVCAFESKQSCVFSVFLQVSVSVIRSDRAQLGSIQERIGLLGSDLSKNFNDTFMSKRTHCDTEEGGTKATKRSRASHGGPGDNTGNGLRHGEHVYHDRQVVYAFSRAGYTLESDDEDENGWAPVNKVKQPSTLSFYLN